MQSKRFGFLMMVLVVASLGSCSSSESGGQTPADGLTVTSSPGQATDGTDAQRSREEAEQAESLRQSEEKASRSIDRFETQAKEATESARGLKDELEALP